MIDQKPKQSRVFWWTSAARGRHGFALVQPGAAVPARVQLANLSGIHFSTSSKPTVSSLWISDKVWWFLAV